MNIADLSLLNLRYSAKHPAVKQALYTALIVLVLMMLILVGYWWPVHSHTENLELAIHTKRKAVIDAARSGDIANSYTHALENIARLENKLANQPMQAELLANTSRVAKKAGVKILAESYQEGRKANGYIPLYQELTLSGTYPSLRKFIEHANALPTYSVVQETKIQRSEQGHGKIKAYLRIATYRKTQENSATHE